MSELDACAGPPSGNAGSSRRSAPPAVPDRGGAPPLEPSGTRSSAGDEIHALRAAVNFPLGEDPGHLSADGQLHPADGAHKVLMGWGVPATEMLFRVPVLLCGLAALLALPAAFAGRVSAGRRSSSTAGWSPSRRRSSSTAGSPGRTCPWCSSAFGAVMAFEAWWRTRSRRAGAAYVCWGPWPSGSTWGRGRSSPRRFCSRRGTWRCTARDWRGDLRDLVAWAWRSDRGLRPVPGAGAGVAAGRGLRQESGAVGALEAGGARIS